MYNLFINTPGSNSAMQRPQQWTFIRAHLYSKMTYVPILYPLTDNAEKPLPGNQTSKPRPEYQFIR
jgi:hypothetical protein